MPKYEYTWDVGLVLKLFNEWPANELLDTKKLSMKLVALIALLSGQRVQTITSIDLDEVKYDGGIQIFVKSVLKTSKPGNPQPCINIKSYPKNKKLCIVQVMREYCERTEFLRSGTKLFVTLMPHTGPFLR